MFRKPNQLMKKKVRSVSWGGRKEKGKAEKGHPELPGNHAINMEVDGRVAEWCPLARWEFFGEV